MAEPSLQTPLHFVLCKSYSIFIFKCCILFTHLQHSLGNHAAVDTRVQAFVSSPALNSFSYVHRVEFLGHTVIYVERVEEALHCLP